MFQNKKIAIVHDTMVAYGGGESVLETLIQLFPDADVYTSYMSETLKNNKFAKVKTSWLQKLTIVEKYPRLIQFLAPFIWNRLELSDYDIIITHSGFYLSNLVNLQKRTNQFTFCYMITPPKNIYFSDHQRSWDLIFGFYFNSVLAGFDKKSAANVYSLAAVSKSVQERIRSIYHRDSLLMYPPVRLPGRKIKKQKKDYYCYAGRLSKEKNIKLIVETFNENKLPLVIVGEGKEKDNLKKIAKRNIKFLGFLEQRKLLEKITSAKAFIHVAQNDDFPLTPIQAMGCGTPVITSLQGGTSEAIVSGKNGIVVKKLNKKSLNSAIKKFQNMTIDPGSCANTAMKYSENRFKTEFLNALKNEYKRFRKN